MGISLYDNNDKQRNMVDVLKEMAVKLGVTADGTSNLSEKQKQQYAAMVGGKTQFDTLMKLLSGLSEEYDTLKGDLDESTGALDEMARVMKDNLGGQIDNMKSAIEGGLIKAFVALEPVLSKVVEMITDAANWFSNLDETQQKNIVTFGLIAAATGPILMGLGQLIIVGGNAVTLFGKLGSSATTTAGATGGLTSALGVLASPVGIGLAIGAIVGLIALLGENENALLKLQEKFGGLGTVIGAVCEFISGTVQMTFGNVWIIISGIMDAIAALIDGPGGLTVTDAWDRMQNRLVLNTEEAMGKCSLATTRGMSQMRHMGEEQLGGLVATTDTLMQQIPEIAEGNYSSAANNIATQLANMDSNQITVLQGMNDTTKSMFQGINSSMTVDQMANQVTWNMQQMHKAGTLEVTGMEKDVSSAMNTFKKNIETKTKEASTSADKNTKDMASKVDKNTQQANQKAGQNTDKLAQEVDKNTKQASNKADTNTQDLGNKIDKNTQTAGNKTDQNTKDLGNKVDANTKEAANKADKNTEQMAREVDSNSRQMKDKATANANAMKNNVTSATSQMASKAISDWQRIRTEYSRTITGKINVTKTTTNVTKSIDEADTQSIANYSENARLFDTSEYQLRGGYYNANTRASVSVSENNINLDLRKIEALLSKKNNADNLVVNINLSEVVVKNDDDYKTMSKKISEYVSVELQKLKNKNKKSKGGMIYA